jgi:hypothetical protein
MESLREFEIDVIGKLTANILKPAQVTRITKNYEAVGFEFTGAGYFLSIKHSEIPKEKFICSHPILIGHTEGDIICGFVIFIENHQLTLECHEWGAADISSDFRDRAVKISVSQN